MRRFTVPITRPGPSSFGNRSTIMRNRLLTMIAALLLVSAGAMAQDKNPSPAPQQDTATAVATPAAAEFGAFPNQIEFGYRGTLYTANSDEARHQRYQDLRDGATVDTFRWGKATSAYQF